MHHCLRSLYKLSSWTLLQTTPPSFLLHQHLKQSIKITKQEQIKTTKTKTDNPTSHQPYQPHRPVSLKHNIRQDAWNLPQARQLQWKLLHILHRRPIGGRECLPSSRADRGGQEYTRGIKQRYFRGNLP